MSEETDGTGAEAHPAFDASATGLRRRGAKSGGTKLTAAAGDVIEVYWSVQNADLVQVFRDKKPIGTPDRATDGWCPLWLAGLGAGNYALKLVAGISKPGAIIWSEDAVVELSLKLTAPLAVTKFWADPEPDKDGKDHLPQDLQLANGTKVKLHVAAVGAKKVQISASAEGSGSGAGAPLDPIALDGRGKGSLIVDPADQPTLYTAVAINGEMISQPAGPIAVHFHAPEDTVSPLARISDGYGEVVLLDASGNCPNDGTVRLGAGDGLQLRWTVAGARSARLTATPLSPKKKSETKIAAPKSVAHVSNDQLVAGVSLPISEEGFGSGVMVIDPGPASSTEYAITVITEKSSAGTVAAKGTAYVANFNVQLKLGPNELAANRSCVLTLRGQPPINGTTNESGQLWLWVPNLAGYATLSIVDGDNKIATWNFLLTPEPGVAGSTVAASGPNLEDAW